MIPTGWQKRTKPLLISGGKKGGEIKRFMFEKGLKFFKLSPLKVDKNCYRGSGFFYAERFPFTENP